MRKGYEVDLRKKGMKKKNDKEEEKRLRRERIK